MKGSDATDFLQGLVTCDVDKMPDSSSHFAMVLNSKGRVLADVFIYKENHQSYYIDCSRSLSQSIINYFGMFRLRADVRHIHHP